LFIANMSRTRPPRCTVGADCGRRRLAPTCPSQGPQWTGTILLRCKVTPRNSDGGIHRDQPRTALPKLMRRLAGSDWTLSGPTAGLDVPLATNRTASHVSKADAAFARIVHSSWSAKSWNFLPTTRTIRSVPVRRCRPSIRRTIWTVRSPLLGRTTGRRCAQLRTRGTKRLLAQHPRHREGSANARPTPLTASGPVAPRGEDARVILRRGRHLPLRVAGKRQRAPSVAIRSRTSTTSAPGAEVSSSRCTSLARSAVQES